MQFLFHIDHCSKQPIAIQTLLQVFLRGEISSRTLALFFPLPPALVKRTAVSLFNIPIGRSYSLSTIICNSFPCPFSKSFLQMFPPELFTAPQSCKKTSGSGLTGIAKFMRLRSPSPYDFCCRRLNWRLSCSSRHRRSPSGSRIRASSSLHHCLALTGKSLS